MRFALDQLLRPAGMAVEPGPAGSGSSPGSLKQLGQLSEALRLWRSFAQHGFYLLLLDDAYPSLCSCFTPPPLPAAVSAAGQAHLQQWSVAREAFSAAAQLCWHAARCGWQCGSLQCFPPLRTTLYEAKRRRWVPAILLNPLPGFIPAAAASSMTPS